MTDSSEETSEVELRAPLRFDPSIGYWTGEADRDAVLRALAAVPEHPLVDRRVEGDAVRLVGPAPVVREVARLLREAGLE